MIPPRPEKALAVSGYWCAA